MTNDFLDNYFIIMMYYINQYVCSYVIDFMIPFYIFEKFICFYPCNANPPFGL